MPTTAPLADLLLADLGRACWQGGLFVLLVWMVCRVFPRLPSAVRFWLWWLASAKCVLAVFCVGIVPIPVFAPQIAALPAAMRSLVSLPLPPPVPIVAPAVPRAEPAPTLTVPEDAKSDTDLPAPHVESAPPAPPLTLAVGAALAYGVGLAFVLLRALYGSLALHGLLRAAAPVTDKDTLAALREIGRFRLRESAQARSPLVAGLWKPVIVLPKGFAQTVTAPQLRLALAHEAAHIQRGDLWLGLLPRLAQTLLYFFPLSHLACRESEEAREELCDAHALRQFPQMRRAEYGQLLLRLVPSVPVTQAIGMASAPGFSRLKRRLECVRRGEQPLPASAKGALFLLTACFATGVAPWRLSAVGATLVQANRATEALFPAVPRYEIVDLGTLDAEYSDAFAISETGQVAGTLSENGRGKAFVYDTARNVRTAVRAPDNLRRSLAVGISHSGAIAASAYNRAARPQAFVWVNGQTTKINGLRGFRYSRASGVNAFGVAAGNAQGGRLDDGALRARAIVFQNGRSRDLGTLGGPYSQASGINDSGLIVGKADLPRSQRGSEIGSTHAFAYQLGETEMRDLGTLPGGSNSRAIAVNAGGEVVGFSETGDGTRAFLAGGNRAMLDLGTLPGAAKSVAHAISDRGWIVGAANTNETGESRAVLWIRRTGEAGGRLMDLNDCVVDSKHWTLEAARGINRQGWIVGQGTLAGKHRAFLLRPIL